MKAKSAASFPRPRQRRNLYSPQRRGRGRESLEPTVTVTAQNDPHANAPDDALPQRAAVSPRDFSMAIALAAIWMFFAIRAPQFLSARNLSLLMIDLSI